KRRKRNRPPPRGGFSTKNSHTSPKRITLRRRQSEARRLREQKRRVIFVICSVLRRTGGVSTAKWPLSSGQAAVRRRMALRTVVVRSRLSPLKYKNAKNRNRSMPAQP